MGGRGAEGLSVTSGSAHAPQTALWVGRVGWEEDSSGQTVASVLGFLWIVMLEKQHACSGGEG